MESHTHPKQRNKVIFIMHVAIINSLALLDLIRRTWDTVTLVAIENKCTHTKLVHLVTI